LAAKEANLQEILVTGCPIPGYRGLRFGLPAKARLLSAWLEDRPDVILNFTPIFTPTAATMALPG